MANTTLNGMDQKKSNKHIAFVTEISYIKHTYYAHYKKTQELNLNYANLFQLIFTLRIFDYISKKRKIQKLSTALRRDLKRAQDNLDFAESVRAVESLKNRINRCKDALKVCEKDIENMNNFN